MNIHSTNLARRARNVLAIGSLAVAGLVAGSPAMASAWTQCAAEHDTCTIPEHEEATVRYGNNGTFIYEHGVSGSISCTNSRFGEDPLYGTPKKCEYREALPEHPEKDDHVLFTGDSQAGKLDPGESLVFDSPWYSSQAELRYQYDGNLVLYHHKADGTSPPVWATDTWDECAGHAELDPTHGLVVRDCNGDIVWNDIAWYNVERQGNFHLEVRVDGSTNKAVMRLFDMNADQLGAIVWEADSMPGERVYEPLTVSDVRNVWRDQGWWHAHHATDQDIRDFQAYLTGPSHSYGGDYHIGDPHSDFHRVIDHHYRRLGVYNGWVDRAEHVFDSVLCIARPTQCLVDATIEEIPRLPQDAERAHAKLQFVTNWMSLARELMDRMRNGEGDGSVDSFFQEIVDTGAPDSVSGLIDGAHPDRALLASAPSDAGLPGAAYLHGALAKRMGQVEDFIRTDVGLKFKLNATKLWDAVMQNPLPANNVLWSDLVVEYTFIWPKFYRNDNNERVAKWQHRLKLETFSGVGWDGSKLAKLAGKPLPWIEENGTGDAGFYGNMQFAWKAEKNYDDGTNGATEWSHDLMHQGGVMTENVTTLFDFLKNIKEGIQKIRDFASSSVGADAYAQANRMSTVLQEMSSGAQSLQNEVMNAAAPIYDGAGNPSAVMPTNLWGDGGVVQNIDSTNNTVTTNTQTYVNLTDAEIDALEYSESQGHTVGDTFGNLFTSVEQDRLGTSDLESAATSGFLDKASMSLSLNVHSVLGGMASQRFELDDMNGRQRTAAAVVPLAGSVLGTALTSYFGGVVLSETPGLNGIGNAWINAGMDGGLIASSLLVGAFLPDDVAPHPTVGGFYTLSGEIGLSFDYAVNPEQEFAGFLGSLISKSDNSLIGVNGIWRMMAVLSNKNVEEF